MLTAKSIRQSVRLSMALLFGVFNVAAADSIEPSGLDRSATPVSQPVDTAAATSASKGDAVEVWLADTVSSESQPIRRSRASKREEAAVDKDGVAAAAMPNGGRAMEMFWPLLVVLGLIALAAIVFRRFIPGARRLSSAGAIEVLGRQYLSNKHSLCLIRVGRRIVLLGVTPERIGPLCEISDAEEQSAIASVVQRGRPDSFTATFKQLSEQDILETDEEVDDDAAVNMSYDEWVRTRQTVRGLTQRVRSMRTHADTLKDSA